ncbi:MAG: hypothetical protein V3V62_07220 [bacterium]
MSQKNGSVKRVQIDLDDRKMEELEMLLKDTGVRTRTELFNYALSLLKWAVKETKNGRQIMSIDEKGNTAKELVMPVLR